MSFCPFLTFNKVGVPEVLAFFDDRMFFAETQASKAFFLFHHQLFVFGGAEIGNIFRIFALQSILLSLKGFI